MRGAIATLVLFAGLSACVSMTGDGSSSTGGSQASTSGSGAASGSTNSSSSSATTTSVTSTAGTNGGPITRPECLPPFAEEVCPEDTYEPNDTPAQATQLVLTGNTTTVPSLASCVDTETGAEDFYRLTLPANHGLHVLLQGVWRPGDLDLYVTPVNDTRKVLASATATTVNTEPPDEELWLTAIPAQTDLLLHVNNFGRVGAGGNTPVRTPYNLTIELIPGGICSPDVLEENDTSGAAVVFPPLDDLTRTPLTACASDTDFYSLTVPNPGQDRVVRLWHPHGAVAATLLQGTNTVATAVTAGEFSTLTWDATAGVAYTLQVTQQGSGPGTDYDIQLARGWCQDDNSENGAGNDTEATATTSLLGRRLCEDDPDYMRIDDLRAGGLTVRLVYEPVIGNLAAIVFAAGDEATPLATLGPHDIAKGYSEATMTAPAGTLYVKVTNPTGLAQTRYRVELEGLAVCNDVIDEPNNEPLTATELFGIQGAYDQTLCSTDAADFFEFDPIQARSNLEIVVSHTTGATLDLAVTEVATGAVVPATTSINQTGDATTLVFASEDDKRYFLQVANTVPSMAVDYSWEITFPVPANDVCVGAIPIANNSSVTGTIFGAANDSELNHTLCGPTSTGGRDVFYRVEVPAGATLAATLTDNRPLFQTPTNLYLLDDCGVPCCWAGTDDGFAIAGQTLEYRNTTTQLQTLILVVDGPGDFGYGTDFGLAIAVE